MNSAFRSAVRPPTGDTEHGYMRRRIKNLSVRQREIISPKINRREVSV